MSDAYTKDGVNVPLGDQFSAFTAELCRETWQASPFVKIKDYGAGHFRGPRTLTFKNLPPDAELDLGPDGIGTKVILITEAFSHIMAAYDVMAMGIDDIARYGGCAVAFSNVLDVRTLGTDVRSGTFKQFQKLMIGLRDIAVSQRIALYKGETAELGSCVGSENPEAVTIFNWAGFAIGFQRRSAMITGKDLRKGHVVVALREQGFRSNGISSVRSAFRNRFGEQWWKSKDDAYSEALLEACVPSIIYGRFIATANGWFSRGFKPLVRMSSIAHISGGGIPSKFAKDILFRHGFSADLVDLWTPPRIMRECKQWRGMTDREAYDTWNGGQGMLVTMGESEVSKFIHLAATYDIEAKPVGCVILAKRSKPRLLIRSKYQSGETIEWQA